MIEFRGVSKHFGTQSILEDVSFRIMPQERVGVVGPNGAGKSTIFSLITNETEPVRGNITLTRDLRIGYLRQILQTDSVDQSVLQYTENARPELNRIESDIHKLEQEISRTGKDQRDQLLERLGELQHRYEHLEGYDMKSKAEAALCGLGFEPDALTKRFTSFSGGWQMRAELARILIADPDLLLLDEPSNYLDLPAVEWLQKYLCGFKGTLMLISHDRYLLRSLTTTTLEVASGNVTRYTCGFDDYQKERKARAEQAYATYANQQKERERIERFIERFRAKNTKASQVQSRIKLLEKMDTIELPASEMPKPKLKIPTPPHCGHEIVRLSDAGFFYDEDHWIFRRLNLQIQRHEKVALVGYNGMGKTTLLRILSGNLALTEGDHALGHQVVPGYQSQDFAETMSPDKTVLQLLKEKNPLANESALRTMAGGFGFSGDAVDKPCSVLSGGEKIRLSFARLFMNPPNFLLLDEPTTHLDIAGREALEEALKTYTGTFCLVSHDVDFVRKAATHIIAINHGDVVRYSGGYDYYRQKKDTQQPSKAKNEQAEKSKPSKNKELRVARARRREMEKPLRDLEKQIADLEEKLLKISDQMASPDADQAALSIEYATIEKKKQAREDQWIAEAEKLDTLA